MSSGWNTQSPPLPPAPWSEFKNYIRGDKWVWETPNEFQDGQLQYMFALSVPSNYGDKDQDRLSSELNWDNIINFFTFVKTRMNCNAKTKFALYFDRGLQPFHQERSSTDAFRSKDRPL